MYELEARGLTKTYNLRPVIREISFRLQTGEALGITGVNGSGKTTLIKALASVLEPSAGEVLRTRDGAEVPEESYPELTGFVAPYLALYPEYTGRELVSILAELRGGEIDSGRAEQIARVTGIVEAFDSPIGELSSGMQQRIRYVLALAHDPPFLFLDEPMTNLDAAGKEAVRRLIVEERSGRVTIIATNDPPDLELCTSRLDLSC